MEKKEIVAMCALNMVFGFEPVTAHALLRHFGGAARVFEASPGERMAAIPYNDKLKSLSARHVEKAEEELERLGSDEWGDPLSFVPFGDPRYPQALAECADAPLGLYVRSSRPVGEMFGGGTCVAVVGTRDMSPYGRQWCREIVTALARAPHPPCIVSGLAYGTDITAHVTALECGIPTIAVMATGADKTYPRLHGGWAGRIADAEGSGLVSDYPLGTAPLPINFIRRNRIIAGLCRAVILVESKARGGGMLTARLAFDYDREVFALPGRIDDLRSQGCNHLIRTHVAHAIETVGMLVEALGMGEGDGPQGMSPASHAAGKGSDAESVANALAGKHVANIDEIAAVTRLPVQRVSATLVTLEAEGVVESDVLGRYGLRVRR